MRLCQTFFLMMYWIFSESNGRCIILKLKLYRGQAKVYIEIFSLYHNWEFRILPFIYVYSLSNFIGILTMCVFGDVHLNAHHNLFLLVPCIEGQQQT